MKSSGLALFRKHRYIAAGVAAVLVLFVPLLVIAVARGGAPGDSSGRALQADVAGAVSTASSTGAAGTATEGEASASGERTRDTRTRTPASDETPTADDTPDRSATRSPRATRTPRTRPASTATPTPTERPATATPTPVRTSHAHTLSPTDEAPVEPPPAAPTVTEPLPDPATPPPTEAPPPPSDTPSAPAALSIPRFGVDAAIEFLGVLPSGYLDSPHDPYNVGFYSDYDEPGVPGNALLSAHVDYYPDIRGPFYNLDQAVPGDLIELTMPDGSVYTYEVISNVRWSVDEIPMEEVIWPSDRPAEAQWITLITCGGDFQPYNGYSGPGYYLHRDVVQAQRIS